MNINRYSYFFLVLYYTSVYIYTLYITITIHVIVVKIVYIIYHLYYIKIWCLIYKESRHFRQLSSERAHYLPGAVCSAGSPGPVAVNVKVNVERLTKFTKSCFLW